MSLYLQPRRAREHPRHEPEQRGGGWRVRVGADGRRERRGARLRRGDSRAGGYGGRLQPSLHHHLSLPRAALFHDLRSGRHADATAYDCTQVGLIHIPNIENIERI